MKMLVLLEVEVPKAMAGTMQRSGFTVAQDGTCFQVKVPNAPAIPQRKTKISFVNQPKLKIPDLLKVLSNQPEVVETPESK